MKPFNIFTRNKQKHISEENTKNKNNLLNPLTNDDYFSNLYVEHNVNNSYLLHAWVNIAINILIRNIARADFTIKNGGDDVTNGQIYNLFRKPNPALSRYDLWKETAAWWHLEGEAFW
jgi:hypothetical protein